MTDQSRLSTSPLLSPQQDLEATGVSMATADVSPAPEQLHIHNQPSETAGTARPELTHQFTLQSQESVKSATGAKINPVQLCTFTLKEGCFSKLSFESGRLTTAQQILSKVREELGIPEDIEQVFSIWLTSKHLQLQLKSYHLPCKLFKRWKDLLSQFTTATFEEISVDEPILSFQRNTFLTLKDERNLLKNQNSDNPNNYCKAIDLLYHEAVFNTTRGRFPLSIEEFHTQAGIQAAVKHLEQSLDFSVMRSDVNTFYPPHMRVSKGGLKVSRLFKKLPETKNLSDEFHTAYEAALKKCQDPHQLKILFLQLCWHKPYYGSVFFKGIVEKPPQYLKLLVASEKHIVVAINTECVHLMSSASPSDVLLFLTYDQLSWEFQPTDSEGEEFFSSLLLEFDSVLSADNKKVSKRVQVFSRQASMMDAMISRCVDCINKREERLRQLRIEQGNKEFIEYSITTNDGRVQKQELNYKEHKLQCTVLTSEDSPGSVFTLSRSKKKTVTPQSDPTPLTPSGQRDTTEMTPLTAPGQRDTTETTPTSSPGEEEELQSAGKIPDKDSSLTTHV